MPTPPLPRTPPGGFDAPARSETEDHLGRWGFAKEIFRLVSESPKEWSVRIAIYGEWGTGKTSVMNFVEQMSRESRHAVTWFNPWQYESQDEMWRDFVSLVYKAVEDSGHKIPDSFSKNAKKVFGSITEVGQQLSKVEGHAEKLASVGIPFLKSWIRFSADDLAQIPTILNGKRMVILVDDLDRTDAHLVPKILFALRQLLDLPGFSFVLGFDPRKVVAALGHAGLKDDLEFLDKIVDFPRWLPQPTVEALIRLAQKDIETYCPFITPDAVSQVINHLPNNPRTLRQFIRHLWCLGDEIKRYNADEIDWPTLILITRVKAAWPHLLNVLFQSEETLSQLFKTSMVWSSMGEEEQVVGRSEDKLLFERVCNEGKVPNEEHEAAINLIMAINSRLILTSKIKLLRIASLVEDPQPITKKEFNQFYIVASTGEAAALKEWLTKHAKTRTLEYEIVFRRAFELLVEHRGNLLMRAADSYAEADLAAGVAEAAMALNVISTLTLTMSGFTGSSPILGSEHYLAVFGMVETWIHFDQPQYTVVRKQEWDFLEALTNAVTCDPGPILGKLQTWAGYPTQQNVKKAQQLYEMENRILRPKVAAKLIEHFRRAGGIREFWHNESLVGEKFVLFEANGCLWTGENRKQLLSLLLSASTQPEVRLNAIEFVHFMDDTLQRCGIEALRLGATWILRDPELINGIWNAAFCVPLNPRVWGTFNEVREKIKKAYEVELPLPKWASQCVPIRPPSVTD